MYLPTWARIYREAQRHAAHLVYRTSTVASTPEAILELTQVVMMQNVTSKSRQGKVGKLRGGRGGISHQPLYPLRTDLERLFEPTIQHHLALVGVHHDV